ncbi:MAG: Holliday junction resolvase RuvX [Candidatus Omnitrophica bacterium]|nr:Holliday junction resolvase RuvX [Candidatus Omnitrophota bacterium]
MSILGLDVGEKRIGVARSDELDFMAHTVGLIERHSEEQAGKEIAKLVDEFQIGKVVVGLPKTMKGTIGTQAQKILLFIETLSDYVSCPILTWDERLTTVEAQKALIAQDVSRSKRKKKIDSVAAEIMLQSYLDFIKQKGSDQHV